MNWNCICANVLIIVRYIEKKLYLPLDRPNCALGNGAEPVDQQWQLHLAWLYYQKMVVHTAFPNNGRCSHRTSSLTLQKIEKHNKIRINIFSIIHKKKNTKQRLMEKKLESNAIIFAKIANDAKQSRSSVPFKRYESVLRVVVAAAFMS